MSDKNESFTQGYISPLDLGHFPAGSPAWHGAQVRDSDTRKKAAEAAKASEYVASVYVPRSNNSSRSVLKSRPATHDKSDDFFANVFASDSFVGFCASLMVAAPIIFIISKWPDEVATLACSAAASAAFCKTVSDFTYEEAPKTTATVLSLVGTGIATYLVATNKLPENTVTAELWKHSGWIVSGIGAAMAAYFPARDWYNYNTGMATAFKSAAGGLLLAAGACLALRPATPEAPKAQQTTQIIKSDQPHIQYFPPKEISVPVRNLEPALAAVSKNIWVSYPSGIVAQGANGKSYIFPCGTEWRASWASSEYAVVKTAGNMNFWLPTNMISNQKFTKEQCNL